MKQECIRRIIAISEADGDSLSLRDFEGILPAPQTSLEDLRDEYKSLLRSIDDMRFSDLEDSCQLQAAVSAGCQYLLTFNSKDYPSTDNHIEIMTPEQFLDVKSFNLES